MENSSDPLDLSEEQVAEFKVAFAMMDRDGDGLIDHEDLKAVMRCLELSPNETELQKILNEIDNDGNGTIDFSQFLVMMSKKMKDPDLEEEILDVGDFLDRDGNGYIGPRDLYRIMNNLGEKFTEEEVEEMIREADNFGDGRVTPEELLGMMTK